MELKTHTDKTHICLTLSLFFLGIFFFTLFLSVSCVRVTLTLNNVGDHEGCAGVIADEMTTSQVMFNLQGK